MHRVAITHSIDTSEKLGLEVHGIEVVDDLGEDSKFEVMMRKRVVRGRIYGQCKQGIEGETKHTSSQLDSISPGATVFVASSVCFGASAAAGVAAGAASLREDIQD